MAAIINDGSFINHGSVLLSITGLGGVGVSYVTENFSVTYPTQIIEINNHLNEPAGMVMTSGAINGTTTIQTATTGTPVPANGSTFGFNSHVFYVTEAGETRSQGEISKTSLNFRKKYN